MIGLEGTAWAASASNIAPARRLRYALLVPRLVAPHRNTGFGTAAGPEQAVALLAQGRVRDLGIFADKHPAVPSLEEAGSSRDWRWRFVAALGRLWIDGDRDAVAARIDDAPNPASRAAACVVTACALVDAERHAEAVALLSDQPDDAGPVDWAWIQGQVARARAELGDVATARQAAAATLRALSRNPDDVTASAIGAAAAQLLFQTAPWGQRPLEELITANDTAVSWWRTQTLSSALIAAADRNFQLWADDQTTRIDFEDTVNNRLLAGTVNAHLTGEQGAWRTMGSLLARDTLIVQHAAGDTRRQTEALDELRRSGDEKSLELAARRLWDVGPLGPLTEAARRIQPGSWTHTTARANLALWQDAGDVIEEDTATDAARYCLGILTDNSGFVARTTPPFHVAHYTLKALAGLLDAADDAFHRDLAAFLVSLPPVTDPLTAQGLALAVPVLRATALAPEDHATWRQAAASQPDRRVAARMLGVLAGDDQAARALLLTRIAQGDDDALAALGDLRQLDTETAGRLAAQDAQQLDGIVAQAQGGRFAVARTRDPAYRLAILGAYFPDVAPWDALLRYLGEARMPSQHKRRACLTLATHADRLPDSVRSDLRELLPRLTGTDPAGGLFGSPLGGVVVILAAAVGTLDDQTLTKGIAALLTGSRQQRRDAATLISRLGRRELTAALVTLVSDPYPDVRAEAACVLAMRVASPDPSIDPLAVAGLQRALADPGALVSLAIADGVAAAEAPSDEARELVAPLLGHPSARVRQATASALHG